MIDSKKWLNVYIKLSCAINVYSDEVSKIIKVYEACATMITHAFGRDSPQYQELGCKHNLKACSNP